MKTNWTKTVNEINRKRYVIPEGWETKEQVAESLQCAPDRVAEMLKPGIANGDIERQEFSVWDEKRRLASRVTCYRLATGEAPKSVAATGSKESATGSKEERIRAAILRHPGLSNYGVAHKLHKVTAVDVKRIKAEMLQG